jgi:signal transduction histidine kinase/ActR/RegA family two-component response regulator
MPVSLKFRKPIHVFLFVAIIAIQIVVFAFWFTQNTNQKALTLAVENATKPNKALALSNFATQYYLEANNSFNAYLQDYNKNSFKKYTVSLDLMSVYLDSLNQLSSRDETFKKAISNKKSIEKKVVELRKDLDEILKNGIEPLAPASENDFEIQKFDSKKILSSIKFDTVLKKEEVKKKGFFSRIGSALSGKNDVEKEKTNIKIIMEFDNLQKIGSFEDQIKNVYKNIDLYYNNQFQKLKNSYFNIKSKDKQLLNVNRNILKNSQDVILFYASSAQEASRLKYQTTIDEYYKDAARKKTLILMLMIFMLACTALLLFYTYHAFIYENKLATAKKTAENNVLFKNRIIGMISHEMRAPLNIISNLSQSLINKNIENNDKINLLYFTSNSLKITANQILDYFKNENSKLAVYITKVNLYQEIFAILESLQSLAEQKNIDLKFEIDRKLDQIFITDIGKIHQLFYNLIGNAIKFTDKGSITANCRFLASGHNNFMAVSIQDTGVGIPKKDIDKVFDASFQSEQHTAQIGFGAGLGLHLCKEIVELLGGKISATSEPNKGTKIDFEIKLDQKNLETTSNKDLLKQYNLSSKNKVVVLDDDKIVLVMLQKILKDADFEVTSFSIIDDFEKQIREKKVDLIVTDLNIHGVSIQETTHKIKNSENINQKTPIIIISGDESITDKDSLTLNFDAFLNKPVNREMFYDKIVAVLLHQKNH